MLKIVLLSALLLTAGIALLPEAAASCPREIRDLLVICRRPILESSCGFDPLAADIQCG